MPYASNARSHLRTSSWLLLLSFASGFACADAPVRHRTHIEGKGGPTIVLENGLGDTYEVWQDVQSKIASECGTTVAYNRAGYTGSDVAVGDRDAKTIVAELRSELRRRGLEPPYVLVGHSLGGLYMQYYAREFANEVAGLVLVDSTHWNQQLLLGAPNAPSADKRGRVILFMSYIARRELADSVRAGEQVHSSPRPTSVPTVVLSSTGVFKGETPSARAEAARLQEDIVASFPGAKHVRVEGSGHYIQKDRPDVVIDSVREVAGCRKGSDG